MRATYKGLISSRSGTGEITDLPFGCSVSFRGRNWTVGGYDEIEGVKTLRLVDRLCTTEISLIPPEEVTKVTGSQWLR